MMTEYLKNGLILLFGASGWGAGIFKIFNDVREDKRKQRADRRSEEEAERKKEEHRIKVAELIDPFIADLNSGEFLTLYKEFLRNHAVNEDGTIRSETQREELMKCPSKLEEIGRAMLAGKLSQAEVYKKFGDVILNCARADNIWKSEDMHYWQLFQLLADAMREEQAKPDSGTASTALGRYN
jgi:hypothetical protein